MVDQTKYAALISSTDDTANQASTAPCRTMPCRWSSSSCAKKRQEKFLAEGLARVMGSKVKAARSVVQDAIKGDTSSQKQIVTALQSVDEKNFTEDITKGKCRPSVLGVCTAITAAPGALVGGLIGGAAGTLACKPKKGAFIGGATLGAVTAIPGAIVGGILQLPVTGFRKAGEAMGIMKARATRGVKSPEMLKLLSLLGEGDLQMLEEAQKEMMMAMYSRCGSGCGGSKTCGGSTEAESDAVLPTLKEGVEAKTVV